MIKFGSALDSIERRSVTLADKIPVTERNDVTPKRNAKSENVTKQPETVTPTVTSVTQPMSNADRQMAYRQRKAKEPK